VVERIVQNSSMTLDFAPARPTEDGGQSVYLYLAVIAADRDQVSGIASVASGATATTETGQTVTLHAYPRNEEAAADGRSWKAYLLAQDVDLAARRLTDIRGELVVYPHSRCARVELALDQPLPQVKSVDGLRVTASDFKWENREASVTLTEEWPAGTLIARTRSEAPFGVTTVSMGGRAAYASEGRSTVSGRPAERHQEFRLVFPQLEEKPARLVLEALVRRGEPERVPFHIADVPLPGGQLPLVAANPRSADVSPALQSPAGGALGLSVRVAGQAAGEGTLSVGLRAARPGEAWRWVSLRTGANGQARLDGLRPGRYEARLGWAPRAAGTPLLGPGRWRGERAEVNAAAGRVTVVPALEWLLEK
jgi:hypothetical protein